LPPPRIALPPICFSFDYIIPHVKKFCKKKTIFFVKIHAIFLVFCKKSPFFHIFSAVALPQKERGDFHKKFFSTKNFRRPFSVFRSGGSIARVIFSER